MPTIQERIDKFRLKQKQTNLPLIGNNNYKGPLFNYRIYTTETVLFIMVNFIYLITLVWMVDLKIILYGILALTYLMLIIRNVGLNHLNDRFFIFYFIFLIYLLILGIYNKNFVSYIEADLFAFGAFIFIFLSGPRSKQFDFYTKIFPKVGLIINIIAIGLSMVHLLKHGIIMANMEVGRGLDNLEGGILSPKQILYGSLLLYPLSIYIKSKKERLIYDVSILLFIFFSLAMASRGSTAVGLIVFILTIIKRRKLKINFEILFNLRFITTILVLIILFLLVYRIPQVTSSVDYLQYRFVNEEAKTGNPRTEEAEDILKNLTVDQYLFGKGLGGGNTYWIFSDLPHGVNIVHTGWIFLILKGGLGFLLLIYGKIVFALIKLWKSKALQPYSFTLIAMLLLEFVHTLFGSFYILSFLFIALFAGSIRDKSNSNFNYGKNKTN